jgi:hypothetical protein
MGSCLGRYNSVMIKKVKVIQHPDGRVERCTEQTHKRDIGADGELYCEDLEQ